jgi:hypothetical protein
MMNLQILYENAYYDRAPFAEDYRAGRLHLVGFAAVGRHFFICDLREAGFGDNEATRICHTINHLNRTKTVWPKANLTGIPAQCLMSKSTSTDDIRARLTEAFLINRDQVACCEMAFNFKCGGDDNRQRIESILKEMCSDATLVRGLDTVKVYLDNHDGMGTDGTKYLHTPCPLCGCRVSLSSLNSHIEKRCHQRKGKPEQQGGGYSPPAQRAAQPTP